MLQPIILAAGKGTRMKSKLPKTLYPLWGKPILSWILETFEGAGFVQPIVVVGYNAQAIISQFPGHLFAMQTDISGTASAVKSAVPHLPVDTEAALIVYGDNPFLKPETITKVSELWKREKPTIIQTSVRVPNFEGKFSTFQHFGRMVRGKDGSLERIVEYKNATDEERALLEVNPAIYCIDAAWLRGALQKIQPNPVNGEYYLTDLFKIAKEEGKKIETVEIEPQEGVGINSVEDAQQALLFSNVASGATYSH